MTRIDRKDALRGVVDRVGAICGRFRIDSLGSQLAACEELVCGGGVVDVLPATAVVTRIGHGPRERAVIHRVSGGSEEIRAALSDLSALESAIR